jgi:hypothetical protein
MVVNKPHLLHRARRRSSVVTPSARAVKRAGTDIRSAQLDVGIGILRRDEQAWSLPCEYDEATQSPSDGDPHTGSTSINKKVADPRMTNLIRRTAQASPSAKYDRCCTADHHPPFVAQSEGDASSEKNESVFDVVRRAGNYPVQPSSGQLALNKGQATQKKIVLVNSGLLL